MGWEKIRLDQYEKEIEDNIENAKRVEDFNKWKILVEETAKNSIKKLGTERRFQITVEFTSPELKEEAIKLLKKHFGEQFKVVK